jgi:hypothetical protein
LLPASSHHHLLLLLLLLLVVVPPLMLLLALLPAPSQCVLWVLSAAPAQAPQRLLHPTQTAKTARRP